MPATNWTGAEWQQHIERLLRAHYGVGGYQAVPDNHRGDAGIEGFSREDGVAYQCYAAQGSLSEKELYEHQRDKSTDDLKKFVENSDRLSAILNGQRIKLWLLVVPYAGSDALVGHLARRATLIREQHAGLPYIASEFAAGVITDSEFIREQQLLATDGIVELPLKVAGEGPKTHEWASNNSEFVETLEAKLRALRKPETYNERLRDDFLAKYLWAETRIQEFRSEWPEAYQRFLTAKAAREEVLILDCLTTGAGPAPRLKHVIVDFSEELMIRMPWLTPSDSRKLSMAAVTDWLGRCPLELEDENGG